MKHEYQPTEFSKTLLTGVFAGIIATCMNLAYNFIYRGVVKYYPSEIINVSSIIFMTMIVCVIGGLLFYMLNNFSKRGNIVYIVIFSVLTVACLYLSLHVNRSNNPEEIVQFRGLLFGTVAITGLIIAFVVPYLEKHSSFYV